MLLGRCTTGFGMVLNVSLREGLVLLIQPIQPSLLQESFGESDDVPTAEDLSIDKCDFLESSRQFRPRHGMEMTLIEWWMIFIGTGQRECTSGIIRLLNSPVVSFWTT